MSQNKIDSADSTSYSEESYRSSAAADINISDSYQVEEVDLTPELKYINKDWKVYYSQYRRLAEVGNMVDRKALWVAGAGWSSPQKEEIMKIIGNGKDTFDTIMINANKTYTIGGDSFAEIIRRREIKSLLRRTGKVVNLKPIAPHTMKIIANKFGIIKRYEQYDSEDFEGKPIATFKPHRIFHLMWNRIGDQIHGQSTLEKLQRTIKGIEECKKDLKILFHRYVKPLTVVSVDTDDSTEITDFKTKWEEAYTKSEIMVVPDQTVKDIKRVAIPQYATLDPLPYLRRLEEDFTKAEGVADVILGVATKEMTEASGKILYLAWEAVVKANQKFMEDQIKAQLGWDVKFKPPASLEPDIKADTRKDGQMTLKKPKPGKNE